MKNIQERVWDLLKQGGTYSVYDLTVKLHLADPRAHIRELKKKGRPITGVWVEHCTITNEGRHTTRFKRYAIPVDELRRIREEEKALN